VLRAARADVATTLGARGEPILSRVSRLTEQMPHYTVGHRERVNAAFAALADLPGLVLAGAPYRGVGLPDCIAQGRSAAAAVASILGDCRPRGASIADQLEVADPPTGTLAHDRGRPVTA
jgi:oxygen-dependent protoporphyrinogen oxidase